MIALSIKQPWAWLIANGIKDIENRTWKTSYRGVFLVHASLRLDEDAEGRESIRRSVKQRYRVTMPDDDRLLRGGIVGQVNLVDVVNESDSPWFIGPIGFVLEDAKPLKFRPYKGRLSFFEVPV